MGRVTYRLGWWTTQIPTSAIESLFVCAGNGCKRAQVLRGVYYCFYSCLRPEDGRKQPISSQKAVDPKRAQVVRRGQAQHLFGDGVTQPG